VSFFSRPRIVAVAVVHAPIALPGGRTLLRVVAEGRGVIVIDGRRHRFRGRVEQDFLVKTAPIVKVRAVGLFGEDAREVALGKPLPDAPAPVEVNVAAPAVPDVHVEAPDLRPPSARIDVAAVRPRVQLRPPR
jgi:hypothetical protein